MNIRFVRRILLSAALVPALAAGAAAAGRPTPPHAGTDNRVLLQADQVVYDGDAKTVAAVGHVEIVQDGRILLADKVTYDQNTDKVTAQGHVSLTDTRGDVAFADHVVLTDRMRDGVLSGFGALIGKNGRLAALSARRIGGRFVIADRANYSPCKICNKPGQRTPIWQVKSERVVYDQQEHRIRFTNATMEVFGVPVFYSPFLSEPDPTVHYASGLLAPELSSSSKIGYFYRQPIYISLSPSNDITLAPMISTKGGEMLGAEYRQRWNASGLWLQGSLTYNAKGGLGGGSGAQEYDHLFGSGRLSMGGDWLLGFDTQLTNNTAYMRYYDISYLDRLVNDLFVENDGGRSRLAVTGWYFQGLRSTDQQRLIPYVLPQIDLTLRPNRDVMGGQFRFNLNSAVITRSDGPDSQRLTGEIHWQAPYIFGDGQIWTLEADARGDFYHVNNDDLVDFPTVPDKSRYLTRGIPYLALDWRWPFIAQARSGDAYILQPIVQLIAQPYGGNPAGLPVEDSSDFEFDTNNLFSVNQLPGYDLIESGPRANLGFMASALLPTGEVQALVGQTYRLKPDPVMTALTGETGNASNIESRLTFKFPHLDVTDRLDFNRANGSVERHEIYVTGTYLRSSVQVSYLQLPDEAQTLGLPSRQQINAQMDVNFYRNWQGFVAVERDLRSGQMLDAEYGLGYEDDCIGISVAYRRKYVNDAIQGLPPSTDIIVRFNLKTGDEPVRPFNLFPQNVFSNPRS